MEKFKYHRPQVPGNEIERCLEMFDKKEAKKRICEFIKNTIDDVEGRIKRHEIIHNVVGQSEQLCGKPNCNRQKLDNSPLCSYHWDIANS